MTRSGRLAVDGKVALVTGGARGIGSATCQSLIARGASATVAYFGFIDTALVEKGFDDSPHAEQLFATFPAVLRKRLSPQVAGEGIVAAIQARKAQVILPRRWVVLSVLRGFLPPLLEQMPRAQKLIKTLDAGE